MGEMDEIRKRAYTYLLGAGELFGNIGRNLASRISGPQPYKPGLSLDGKVCVITGGNAGIGFETATEMSKRGCHLILACRNMEKANTAAEVLRRQRPQSKVEVAEVNLSSLASVRAFCKAFNAQNLSLDFLILNAGIMATDGVRRTTPDGLEEHFQVNYLSHWLMAHRLVGEQRRRRKKLWGLGRNRQGIAESTRVLFLSSCVHTGGDVDLEDLQLKRGRYSGFRGYTASKLQNVLAAKHLDSILSRDGRPDAAVAVHPGIVQTSMAKDWLMGSDLALGYLQPLTSALFGFLAPVLLASVAGAVRTVVYASLAPSSEVGGKYVAFSTVATSSKKSRDLQLAAGLWEASMHLTGEEPWEDS